MTVTTTVNATKTKIDATEALPLLKGIDTLIAIKGKKIETVDLKKQRPGDEAILGMLMGPTGNLRAPTAKVGKTMIVGFNPEAYGQLFG